MYGTLRTAGFKKMSYLRDVKTDLLDSFKLESYGFQDAMPSNGLF